MKKSAIVLIIAMCLVIAMFSTGCLVIEALLAPDEETNTSTTSKKSSSEDYISVYFYTETGVQYAKIDVDTSGTAISMNMPKEPTKEGYKFGGWYLDQGTWQQVVNQKNPLSFTNSDIKLYAKWIPQSFIKYFVDGKEYDIVQGFEGDSITLLPFPDEKEGYSFGGWKQKNGQTVPDVLGSDVMEIYGEFIPNDYDIYLDLDLGISIDGEYYSDGSCYYLQIQYGAKCKDVFANFTLTKEGSDLDYWEYDGEYFDNNGEYTFASDITIKPVWAKKGTEGFVFSAPSADNTCSITGYTGSEANIVIPVSHNGARVVKIANSAFSGNTVIESVEIQSSITEIGAYAFKNCSNLAKMYIPATVATIAKDALKNVSGLQILSQYDKAPDGWKDTYLTPQNVVFNNTQLIDKNGNPQKYVKTDYENNAIVFDLPFVPSKVEFSDGKSAYTTLNTEGINISGNEYTISVAYLDALFAGKAEGTYTIRFTEYISAKLTIQVSEREYWMYDLASNNNLTIGLSSNNLQLVVGGGIVNNIQAKTSEDYSKTGSYVVLNKSYLSTLELGVYDYLATFGNGTEEYFKVKVINTTDCVPYNVKLDGDKENGKLYITFDCDCGNAHQYSIDDGAYQDYSDGAYITDDKNTHKVTIKCNNNKDQTCYYASYTVEDRTSLEDKYFDNEFTVNGDRYDFFVDDQQEFNALAYYLSTLAMDGVSAEVKEGGGYYVEAEVAFSGSFYAELCKKEGGRTIAIQKAQNSFEFPFPSSMGYSVATLQGTTVYFGTVTMSFANLPIVKDTSTGYEKGIINDSRYAGEKYQPLNDRASNYDGFKINSSVKTQTIKSTYELDNLELGVKPVFTSDAESQKAKTIYEKALKVCREYLSDDMTDYEKVRALYTWIAYNTTYDYSVLDIVATQEEVNSATTLVEAKGYVQSMLANYPAWATDSAFVELDQISTLADYKTKLSFILKSQRVFYLNGVFDDGLAVCDGIASAFKLLCTIEGIECMEVSGYAGESHAWNKVKIDGNWYGVDVTWARSNVNDGFAINYQWCLVDESVLMSGESGHYQRNENGEFAVETIATSTSNYYNTVVIDAVKGYDLVADSQEELNAIFAYAKANGETYIEFSYNISGTDLATAISEAVSNGYKPAPGSAYTYTNAGNKLNAILVMIK